MSMLSTRGTETIETLDLPWKFAPKGNYSQENPSGLIAFASAENVSLGLHIATCTVLTA